MQHLKIAVFVSGGGTNLQALIDHIEEGEMPARIECVLSSKEDAYGLERARNHNIEGIFIGKKNYPECNERTCKILGILENYKIDLIVLAGYMGILDKAIIEEYRHRIINIHPSLIPSFCGKGFYGEKVHEGVLAYGAKITGATVHFVDEGTDTGPIILQKSVSVEDDDTVESLAKRVLKVEHELLPKAVKLFSEGRLKVEGRCVKEEL
ncbi:phosphoribosylglycinamide formyltransferase [Lutibacter sp. B2]|nr:phosphoribosylglycinamide formyltransferase [Lutibacter sp. B2]